MYIDILEQEFTSRKMVVCFGFQTKYRNTCANCVHNDDVGQSVQKTKRKCTWTTLDETIN